MTTKQYLNKINRLYYVIQNKLMEVNQLRVITYTLSGVSNEKDRVKSSGSKDKMGDSVAKLVDLENELKNIIEDYTKQRIIVVGQIEQIENNQYYNVLFKRYVLNESLNQISHEMNYALSYVKQIHKEALEYFESIYGESYKEVA